MTIKEYTLKKDNKDYILRKKIIETETNISVDNPYSLDLIYDTFPKYNNKDVGIIEHQFNIPMGLKSIYCNYLSVAKYEWLDNETLCAVGDSSSVPSFRQGYIPESFIIKGVLNNSYSCDLSIKEHTISIYPLNYDTQNQFDILVELVAGTITLTIQSKGASFSNYNTVVSTSWNYDYYDADNVEVIRGGTIYLPVKHFQNSFYNYDFQLVYNYLDPSSMPSIDNDGFKINASRNEYVTTDILDKVEYIRLISKLTTTPIYRGLNKMYTLRRKTE